MINSRKYQTFYQKYRSALVFSLSKSIYLTILSLLISCFVFAQNNKQSIKLNFKNVPVSEVITSIEKQSTFNFFYNNEVELSKKISINITSADIDKILSSLLKDSSVDWKVSGQRIVLFVKRNIDKQTKVYSVFGMVSDAVGPIIGASIATKDGKGAITSIDGNFRLDNIHIGDVLTISFVGYKSKNLVFNGQPQLNIILNEDTEELDEVVVTALGIKRSEKALAYNVQQVKGEVLTAVKDANFMNSLTGKVAGVQINSGATGAGSRSRCDAWYEVIDQRQ